MKLWWELDPDEQFERTKWAMGVASVIAIGLAIFESWTWLLGLPIFYVVYARARRRADEGRTARM